MFREVELERINRKLNQQAVMPVSNESPSPSVSSPVPVSHVSPAAPAIPSGPDKKHNTFNYAFLFAVDESSDSFFAEKIRRFDEEKHIKQNPLPHLKSEIERIREEISGALSRTASRFETRWQGYIAENTNKDFDSKFLDQEPIYIQKKIAEHNGLLAKVRPLLVSEPEPKRQERDTPLSDPDSDPDRCFMRTFCGMTFGS